MKLARDLLLPYREGEAPWSYCSRIAHHIGVTAKAFARDAGTSLKQIVFGESEALQLLSEVTQTDPSTLRRHSPMRITSGRSLLRGEVLTAGLINRSRTRFCPLCLASQISYGGKPSILTDWAITPITVCAKHNVEIQTLTNLSSHTWDTVPILDHVMATQEQRTVVPKFPAAFELHLLSRLSGTPDDTWLSRIPFYAVVELSTAVGTSQLFDVHTTLQSMSPQSKHDAACMGYEVLSGGEENILEYLEIRDYLARGKEGHIGPFAIYGPLYSFLTRRIEDNSFDYFRDLMQGHFLNKYPHGDEFFGKAIKGRKVHSLRILSASSGLTSKKIRNLVASDGYIGYSVRGNNNNKILLPTEVAVDLLSRSVDSCSLRQLVTVLGSTERQANALSKSSLVPQVLRRGQTVRYSKSAAIELRDSLIKTAALGRVSGSTLVPLHSHSLRMVASEVEIIRLLLEGRLKRVGLNDDRSEIKSLLVSKDELVEILQRELPGLTVAEIGRRLQLLPVTIQKLHGMGVLPKPSVSNPSGRRPALLTPIDHIADFEKTYISLGLISKRLGIHPVKVYRALDAAGLRPAFDRSTKSAIYFTAEVGRVYPQVH